MSTYAVAESGSALGGWVRHVSVAELALARDITEADPLVHGFLASRIALGMRDNWRMGGGLWGYFTGGGLESILFVGANIVPSTTTHEARLAFAQELVRTGRRSSALLGPRTDVLGLWDLMSSSWGLPREVRANQPYLSLEGRALGARDPRVRHVTAGELPILLPASIHMFTEEVGVSPILHGGQVQYERRVAEVIAQRHAFAIIENNRVLFKAEVGYATPTVAQIQGVWVAPELRGHGMAAPAVAAVADIIQREIAPTVTLYVNDFNTPALRTYARAGFRQCDTFATVLF
ncbi:MAG: GNAT family N-acetyltransferase [Candidatus Nanopelagicales bacterium]|nr:GNAT family N-acetyltransferase [Candidatus Nanopelagicales bacterium]MCF8538702.1 GNAT family N-acetyltransferase [Candidatus Nanopelagicales bacterium]MCF8550821.1 GNAT family N-acetyltransferase [Candidatus Nanopelagicales bacterium]